MKSERELTCLGASPKDALSWEERLERRKQDIALAEMKIGELIAERARLNLRGNVRTGYEIKPS